MVLKNADFKRTLKNKKRYHVCEERYKVGVDTSAVKDYISILNHELGRQINVSEGRNGFDLYIIDNYQNVLLGIKDGEIVYIRSRDTQSVPYDNICPNNYLADSCCTYH